MRVPSLLSHGAVVLIATSLLLTGCAGKDQPKGSTNGGAQAGSGGGPNARVPQGAKTARGAAQQFFAAYKAHDRNAAKAVASDAAINKLVWNPSAGNNPTLQLIDDTHIYYEGGSIELHIAQNAAGRYYVRSVTLRAD